MRKLIAREIRESDKERTDVTRIDWRTDAVRCQRFSSSGSSCETGMETSDRDTSLVRDLTCLITLSRPLYKRNCRCYLLVKRWTIDVLFDVALVV